MKIRAITPFAIAAVLACSTLLQAADKPRTVKASFAAQMDLSAGKGGGGGSAPKAGAAKSQGASPLPGFSGKLNFDGKLLFESPRLRLDMVEKNTGESLRIQVNFETSEALLLYPDTLNGIKGKLSQIDDSGYIAQFRNLLQQGDARGKLPSGWSRSKAGSEKVGGSDSTKWNVSGPKGEEVTWWIGKDDKPLKVTAGKGGSELLSLNFSDLSYDAAIPEGSFNVSKDYTVLAFKER